MEVVVGPEHCAPRGAGSAVTIGAYDGVHLGHRHLLGQLRRAADERGLEAVVVTFDRHPAAVVRPGSAPLLLTDLEQKLELLAAAGVDRTLVVPFDESRAAESAEHFVDDVLLAHLGARLVVVGRDFHFGHGRRGNVALLEAMGSTRHFEVAGAELEHDAGGEVVSSTRIRALLARGQVADAAALLGRHHEVRAPVVRGDGRGGPELGFPTANLAVPAGTALPSEGIYACWYLRPDGERHRAAVSLGRRLTFFDDRAPVLLEAYLLDFEGDLYGERAGVAFVDRLRDELRFDDVDELTAQMARDVEEVRALLV